MSEIIKTEALVLSKLNYGDSSSITSLFTKDYGRMSALVKGGRNPKSKIAHVIDPLNYVNIVIYRKDSRELQLLTSADIIEHYPNIKNNLEKLKYSYSVLELVKNLLPEDEVNQKIFKGTWRILKLIDTESNNEKVLFSKYFLFFISQIGYEIQLNRCSDCGKAIGNKETLSYNSQIGILCSNCKSRYPGNGPDAELFNCLKSLKLNSEEEFPDKTYTDVISFLERYIKIHIPDFKGLQSLKMFN
jgi:DNA repair protein RecO (recombination protein O)